MTGILNAERIREFQENGYLILRDVFKPEECKVLLDECHRIVDDFDISKHPKTIFTTGSHRATNEYFITSSDKIRFFFEEKAFDVKGQLVVDKHLSLNKIGHALHALNSEFKKITFDQRIQDSMQALGFQKPAVCQSMFIFKQPRIGGEVIDVQSTSQRVVAHQDATFLHTTPNNLVGIWIALEDCTVDNSCLWFVPGSHKDGLTQRFVREPSVSEFATSLKGSPFHYDASKYVPAEVKAGSMVIIHGLVVHKSEVNQSNKSRNIYTFHVVEQENTEWSKENWLQPTDSLPFMPLFAK